MTNNKTHYRKVFKSSHLGVADLEDLIESGSDLVFTIKEVKQQLGVTVAGKKGDHNIAYFTEDIKPLVLNVTNSTVLKKLIGGSPFVEDWNGIKVQLYIETGVRFKRDMVSGIRIKDAPVAPPKATITPDTKASWEHAKNAYKRDGNFDKVLSRANISLAHQHKIMAELENDDDRVKPE